MVAPPLSASSTTTTGFAKHESGHSLRSRAREAVAQKDPRRHGGVECHSDVDFKPSNTPNGAGTAKNADMELKIKALTTMAGAPVPTPRDRVNF